jgi:hypothetical protein
MRCYELVDLTLRDAQELRDICDEEGAPFPVEGIRETYGHLAHVFRAQPR